MKKTELAELKNPHGRIFPMYETSPQRKLLSPARQSWKIHMVEIPQYESTATTGVVNSAESRNVLQQ
jgi:hypothetical protein